MHSGCITPVDRWSMIMVCPLWRKTTSLASNSKPSPHQPPVSRQTQPGFSRNHQSEY
uniref:Uncharacterized protein n=1 Tax=Roseihalotalea indica TaxID=2867963 RepID=A0AA49JEA6_9BACT|nr:hypothetical protein K4G66_03835 [Tunicatimonas sp. TK19036]